MSEGNILEQIRSRHHPGKSGGCSCGDPGPCDAAIAVDIGLDLYDYVTLRMGNLATIGRLADEAYKEGERVVALIQEY